MSFGTHWFKGAVAHHFIPFLRISVAFWCVSIAFLPSYLDLVPFPLFIPGIDDVRGGLFPLSFSFYRTGASSLVLFHIELRQTFSVATESYNAPSPLMTFASGGYILAFLGERCPPTFLLEKGFFFPCFSPHVAVVRKAGSTSLMCIQRQSFLRSPLSYLQFLVPLALFGTTALANDCSLPRPPHGL